MKEPSIFSLAGMCAGLLFGMVTGFVAITQKTMDTYIGIGKAQVSWRINEPSLERCAEHLRTRQFDNEGQWAACAHFIEQAIEAVK